MLHPILSIYFITHSQLYLSGYLEHEGMGTPTGRLPNELCPKNAHSLLSRDNSSRNSKRVWIFSLSRREAARPGRLDALVGDGAEGLILRVTSCKSMDSRAVNLAWKTSSPSPR
jgi:hypothetical protein